jgi:hypothetical protein
MLRKVTNGNRLQILEGVEVESSPRVVEVGKGFWKG